MDAIYIIVQNKFLILGNQSLVSINYVWHDLDWFLIFQLPSTRLILFSNTLEIELGFLFTFPDSADNTPDCGLHEYDR